MANHTPTHLRHNFKDMTDQRFGRLTVLWLSERSGRGPAWWFCRCDCGKSCHVRGDHLRRKRDPVRSCGCGQGAARTNLSHGETCGGKLSPEFRVWCGLRKRCRDPLDTGYKNYGGRGITVCDRWLGRDGFVNFLADMGRRPSAKHSLDRKDNDGPYSPENCRWATRREQNNNRRDTTFLTLNGRTMSISEWARELGIGHGSLYSRKQRGWSDEDILTVPVRRGTGASPREIQRARDAVNGAVRSGRFPAASSIACIRCGQPATNYHHYKGYAPENRLDVVPTCLHCHRRLEALGTQAVLDLLLG